MEFETETPDYSVPEFYRKYGHSLPQLVLVSQGFYGDIVEDTFDKNQVLRIQTVASQSRVVVKWTTHGQVRMHSMPLSFEGKMCVIKKHTNKHGKEKTIKEIVNKHTLPVMVQFPKDRTLHVNGQNLHTNYLPNIELVQVFEEMYLMANFVLEGTVGQDVVPVPLYLSDLRLARCTGLKKKPEDEWIRLLASMTRKCSAIQYNQDFGNPNIAVYNVDAIHNETEYSYAEPATYTSLYQMFKANVSYDQSNKESRDMAPDETQNIDGNVYELIEDTSISKQHTSTVGHAKTTKDEKRKPVTVPPPILPKPSVLAANMTSQGAGRSDAATPSLPPRNARAPSLKTEQKPVPKNNVYTNDIPKSTVAPMKANTEASSAVPTSPDETCMPLAPPVGMAQQPETRNSGSDIAQTRDKTVTCGADVEQLNISDVGEYLKALQLEKYMDRFKNELIDGPMLRELDRDILKETFGMNALEVIRLMKFIRDGHVPS